MAVGGPIATLPSLIHVFRYREMLTASDPQCKKANISTSAVVLDLDPAIQLTLIPETNVYEIKRLFIFFTQNFVISACWFDHYSVRQYYQPDFAITTADARSSNPPLPYLSKFCKPFASQCTCIRQDV